MLINPQRAQQILDDALAKIRMKTRMRLGLVAGAVIVGLSQTGFHSDAAAPLDKARDYVQAAGPVLALAVAGVFLVVALSRLDIKRAREAYDSQRFRIPTRKTPR